MAEKRKQSLSHGWTNDPKRVRVLTSPDIFQMLSKLHSSFQSRSDLTLKFDADGEDSVLMIEMSKPSFLRYLSLHTAPVMSSHLLSQPIHSSLKISCQNGKDFEIVEKHMVQCFLWQHKTSSPMSWTRWKALKDLVDDFLRSWHSQYFLLENFFLCFASWTGDQGYCLIVRKATDAEAQVLELELELWKETERVCDVFLTVFSQDWVQRPKLEVELRTGEIQRRIAVRNNREALAALNEISTELFLKNGPLWRSPPCSTEEDLSMASSMSSSANSSINQPQLPSKQFRVKSQPLVSPKMFSHTKPTAVAESTTGSKAIQSATGSTSHHHSAILASTKKPKDNLDFVHEMQIFANSWRGLDMQTHSNKNSVILFENHQISLAQYARFQLPSGSSETSIGCKLSVKKLGDNKGFFVKEILCRGELFHENWESTRFLKSLSAIRHLITSWKVQVDLLKEFFGGIDQFLDSQGLVMTVTPQEKLLQLRMAKDNRPYFTFLCQLMVPLEKRPLIQIDIVKTGQLFNSRTFLCKTKSQVCCMLKKLECSPPREAVNCGREPEKLFNELKCLLRVSEGMAPVTVPRCRQEILRLSKMVENLQKKHQVQLKFNKDYIEIQASSGPYSLKITLDFAYYHFIIRSEMVMMSGPRMNHCQFILQDKEHFVENLSACLSHFCSRAQDALGQIVVEVIRDDAQVKQEETDEAGRGSVPSETDFWVQLANLKPETGLV